LNHIRIQRTIKGPSGWSVYLLQNNTITILLLILLFLCITGQTSEEVTIPMDFSAGRATVQVQINNEGPYPFVFDTGAPEGVIDSRLAKKLRLSVIDTVEIGDGMSVKQTERVNVGSLKLGEAEFSNVVLDKLELSSRFHSYFLGVIGMSLFSDYLLTIDYPNRKISFGSGELIPQRPNTIEFIVDEGLFRVPIQIDSHTIPLHLDSGSSSGFTLPKQRADSLNLLTEPVEMGRARTVGHELRIWRATLEGVIRFADLEFINPEVSIIEGMKYGQIGQGVLKNLIITIDQKQHLLYIQKPQTERDIIKIK
jgi:predicted aspartyl protease